MAIFDTIGKQISNVTQNVAHQTKTLADITQLNSAISDKQSKIQQLYLSVGQAFYEAHKTDPSAEEGELIGKINMLFEEISQCRDKIGQLRGNHTCPNCGREVSSNAQYCDSCGLKIEKIAPSQQAEKEKSCAQCGAPISEGNVFCTQCGYKL